MAAYDLQEQEQLAALKAWWQDRGRYLALILVFFILGLAAWYGWKHYQRGVAAEATGVLLSLQDAQAQPAKFKQQLTLLKTEFAATPAAARGALLAAQQAYAAGDRKQARIELEWVIANSQEADVRDLTRARLAGVELDEKAFDKALALVKAPESEAYAGLFAEVRGDALLLKGSKAEAAAAYAVAIAKLPKGDPALDLLKMKQSAAGGK